MIKSEIHIHKVWRSELGLMVLYLVLSIFCIVISNRFPDLTIKGELFSVSSYNIYLFLPILWFVPIITLMIPTYNIYNVLYKIDNRGIEAIKGRIALKQTINRVRYEDIRGIDIEQTIIQRMLDVGTLRIGTAASADSEVTLEGIEAPYEVKDMLERERDARVELAQQSNKE